MALEHSLYSKEFIAMIKDFHQGKEKLPFYENYIEAHLDGKGSRLHKFLSCLLPEIELRCGKLTEKRILDFGCGTGATTAALATKFSKVVVYDIDKLSIDICRQRVKEHGASENVTFYFGDFDAIKQDIGKFDFILLNGVIEHIPLSHKGLRKKILLDLFALLNPGGYIFINETPNRLFPYDFHTTKLWWLPWMQPGSGLAYKIAVKNGKHVENEDNHSSGALGLEERGVWGATYFEIRNYLSGCPYKICNMDKGQDKHLSYVLDRKMSFKRRLFEVSIYYIATKCFRMPITCFSPSLTNLVIQKTK